MGRTHATFAAPLAAALLAAASACGPSAAERLAGTVVAPGAHAVSAFEADLAAGRIDEALRRSTAAFQRAAPAASVREFATQFREELGARKGGGSLGVEDVETEWNPPRACGAVMVCETPFERGTATVRARVERDHVTGTWLLDSYEIRSDRFSGTLRR